MKRLLAILFLCCFAVSAHSQTSIEKFNKLPSDKKIDIIEDVNNEFKDHYRAGNRRDIVSCVENYETQYTDNESPVFINHVISLIRAAERDEAKNVDRPADQQKRYTVEMLVLILLRSSA